MLAAAPDTTGSKPTSGAAQHLLTHTQAVLHARPKPDLYHLIFHRSAAFALRTLVFDVQAPHKDRQR